MSPTDHYALSLRCRRKAEQELEQNDFLTAAEMKWGAVAHALKHIAPQYTRSMLNSHRDMQRAVPEIDAQLPNINLQQYFGAAESLHRYFYRFDIADHQVRNNFRQCQRLLDRLLA